MNKNLMPIVTEFLSENEIDSRAAIFFFASIVRTLLSDLEENKFEKIKDFKQNVLLFILDE